MKRFQCVVSVSIVGSDYFLSMGVFVCVLVSECLRRRCCQPARPRPSPPPHARRPPSYLHDCSLVHWETSRWCHSCVNIAMATPLFPLPTMPHTQSRVTHPHPPNLKTHTHTYVRAEFLGLHPVQDKLNPHAPPAIFENSIHGSSLFQSTLGEVCSNNFAFFPPLNHIVGKKRNSAALFSCV